MIHVLAGDSLAADFKLLNIAGDIIVCHEAFIEGDLEGDMLEELFKTRARFIALAYGEPEEKYHEHVAAEFLKLINHSAADVCLWFEYELFCQVNMWFVLSLLEAGEHNVFRVAPVTRTDKDKWLGSAVCRPRS
jgi:Domain of unknown function (DUF1835)